MPRDQFLADRKCRAPDATHLEAVSWCCDEHRQQSANEWMGLHAEIRRLRQYLYEVQNPMLPNGESITIPELYVLWQDTEKKLAAHRAVVRELTTVLDVDATPDFANEGDMIAWIERKNAALAHPLVQQAREAKG